MLKVISYYLACHSPNRYFTCYNYKINVLKNLLINTTNNFATNNDHI